MTTLDTDTLRRDRAALVTALTDAGAKFASDGKACRCAFHEDGNPSAGIYQSQDGSWRFKCHAAACAFHGDLFDVEARATGKTVAEVLRDKAGPMPKKTAARTDPEDEHVRRYPTVEALRQAACYEGPGKPPLEHEATFLYCDPATRRPDMIVFRLLKPDGDKTFRQGRPEGDGFALRRPSGKFPVYNRTRLVGAPSCVIAEGEKCVHALAEVGIIATTSPGGAGKAKYADWSPLAGMVCYLWPDADAAGAGHMRDVAEVLGQLDPPADVRLIDPESIGLTDPGDDVVDYLERLGGPTADSRREAVRAALDGARPLSASAELHQRIEDAIAGKFASVPWPWPALSRLTKATVPGTVTLVCGDPGAAKSFLLLQSAIHWTAEGVKVAAYELEEDRAFWLSRALAMLAGCSDVTDPDWVRHNGPDVRDIYATRKAELDAFARRLAVAGDKQLDHAGLLAWIRQQAEGGARILIVDPVTALASTDRPWADDLRLMMEAKAIAGRHGASLMLVTHPRVRRGKGGSPLDDLAGGAAYARFAQTVLWVGSHPHGKHCRWLSSAGAMNGTANRTVKIAKARNAAGGGLEVAFNFDGKTLRFDELGVVTKTDGAEGE
jgi:hypothetical protein